MVYCMFFLPICLMKYHPNSHFEEEAKTKVILGVFPWFSIGFVHLGGRCKVCTSSLYSIISIIYVHLKNRSIDPLDVSTRCATTLISMDSPSPLRWDYPHHSPVDVRKFAGSRTKGAETPVFRALVPPRHGAGGRASGSHTCWDRHDFCCQRFKDLGG